MVHIPVLQKEVIQYLDPKPNENFIDCTIGGGGHALAIIEKTSPVGKVLGIDSDSEIIKCLKPDVKHLLAGKRLILVCDNFVNLKNIVKNYKFGPIQGILFDLGMSSWHLEESGRGFSFQKEEKLDMRYNPQITRLTAGKIINNWPEKEIEKILKEYSQERFARKISREIIKEREKRTITTTLQLVEIIKRVVPKWYQHRKIHFATKTFQALRITVNDELNSLEKALPQALETLIPGGRLITISFHSLEDRICKNFFKAQAKDRGLEILTKKPIGPEKEEIEINPRCRSAKLRVATKL